MTCIANAIYRDSENLEKHFINIINGCVQYVAKSIATCKKIPI
jgi:hypothetical protein